MRVILFIFLIGGLAFSWAGILPGQTTTTNQSSDEVRYWKERITRGSPSKVDEKHLPSQLDVQNTISFEMDAEYRMLQEKHRMWLLIAIVVSTPVILALVLFCLKSKSDCHGESLVNAIGLVLVIEGTMFIAVSAVTTEQLTAPIGILGAIAGYLFGSAKRRAAEES